MFTCLILLFTFPRWRNSSDTDSLDQGIKPFPSRTVSQWALAIAVLASLCAFVSAFWQHISCATGAAMVRSLSYGTVNAVVGAEAMILAWGSVCLVIVVAVGLLVMILSIGVLEDLLRGLMWK